MLLTDVQSKARDLLEKAITRTIAVYDPSKNKVIVSGLILDGVVKATLSAKKIGDSPMGVDQNYFGFYDVWDVLNLEVVLLPTAKANDALNSLSLSQRLYKGFVKVTILENGTSIGTYNGYIQQTPSIGLDYEGQDKTFSFILKQQTVTAQNITSSVGSVNSEIDFTIPEG